MPDETSKTKNDGDEKKQVANADGFGVQMNNSNFIANMFKFFQFIFIFNFNFFKSPKDSQDKQDTNNEPTTQSKTSQKILWKDYRI